MNGPLPPVCDEDLHRFVDGELNPSQREALLRFLAASPADAARVEDWRRQSETIRAAFARVAAEPIPFSLALTARGTPREGLLCKLLPQRGTETPASPSGLGASLEPARKRRQAMLIALAFASGIAAAFVTAHLAGLLKDNDPLSGRDRARLGASEIDDGFIERTRSALSAFPPAPGGQAPRPAATEPPASPTALIVPNLSEAGLRFSGVRVFPGATDASFCIFYAIEPDAKAALCVERADGTPATGFMVSERLGLRTISWRQQGARYALAAPLAESEIRRVAEQAHADVEAFDRR